MKCIDCKTFSLKDAGSEMARQGLGVCPVHSRHAGHMHTATFERECADFAKATAATVQKRRRVVAEPVQGGLL